MTLYAFGVRARHGGPEDAFVDGVLAAPPSSGAREEQRIASGLATCSEVSPNLLDQARAEVDLAYPGWSLGVRDPEALAVKIDVAKGRARHATPRDRPGRQTHTRPRRLQFSGVDSLTASELRVALMAAEGQSDPQIAQALFVTAKTVENHPGRVYIKLTINSRGQLVEALTEGSVD